MIRILLTVTIIIIIIINYNYNNNSIFLCIDVCYLIWLGLYMVETITILILHSFIHIKLIFLWLKENVLFLYLSKWWLFEFFFFEWFFSKIFETLSNYFWSGCTFLKVFLKHCHVYKELNSVIPQDDTVDRILLFWCGS